MSDSDSDEIPTLVSATGSAGAKTGMTNYEIQQAQAALEAKGGGKPGVDYKVPVSIVTGFLGSGKSTLVKHILSMQTDKKIAVMVNEFGDSNDIERSMRVADKGDDNDDWIEMSNGCMCCKFKEKAVEALENLVKRRGRFDHIVIETSGLADPAPLIAMFWQDLDLESPLSLNGVVTLIDAKNILGYLSTASSEEHGETAGFVEASQQIALADSIIINKADLVTKEELAAVSDKMKLLNPDSPQQVVSFSKVLDVEATLSLPAKQVTPMTMHSHVSGPDDHHCTDACTHGAKHTSSIGSITIETPDPFPSKSTIDHLMKLMLWDVHADAALSTSVLRLKALIHAGGEIYTVQAVGDLYDTDPVPPSSDHLKCNRIVIIGRGLSAVNWREKIDQAVAATKA